MDSPPADVKKEHNPLEGLGLSLSPMESFKRPFELPAAAGGGGGGGHDDAQHDAKRLKTEAIPADEEPMFEFDVGLLVQNALSNFNDELHGQQSNQEADVVPTTEPSPSGEILSLDATTIIAEPAPTPVAFLADPEKYLREVNLNALASLVR